jgi:hypothetical protein
MVPEKNDDNVACFPPWIGRSKSDPYFSSLHIPLQRSRTRENAVFDYGRVCEHVACLVPNSFPTLFQPQPQHNICHRRTSRPSASSARPVATRPHHPSPRSAAALPAATPRSAQGPQWTRRRSCRQRNPRTPRQCWRSQPQPVTRPQPTRLTRTPHAEAGGGTDRHGQAPGWSTVVRLRSDRRAEECPTGALVTKVGCPPSVSHECLPVSAGMRGRAITCRSFSSLPFFGTGSSLGMRGRAIGWVG